MERLHDEILREDLFREELPYGLTGYVLPKQGYQKKFATFATHYGSIDNRFALEGEPLVSVPDGIAHFLEHKLFEEPDGNASDRFAELGASSNAFTNYTSTTYLFSATDRYRESLSLLLDFVQNPYFTEENVEKEKGIIEQEIRMYLDDPRWRGFHLLMEAVFQEHPVRIDIGGTVESIRSITVEDLNRCYRTFYHPSNMTFFAVGDVDPEETFAIVRERISRHDYPQPRRIQREYPLEPPEVRTRSVEEHLPVSMPIVNLGFKDTAANHIPFLERELTTGLVLETVLGRSSSLYASLYEEGLIDEKFSIGYFSDSGFGLSIVGAETPDPDRLMDRLLEGLARVAESGLDLSDFERIRRKNLGELAALFNSPEAIATAFNSYHFKGYDFFQYRDALLKVRLEDVNERLRQHFRPEHLARSVILPR